MPPPSIPIEIPTILPPPPPAPIISPLIQPPRSPSPKRERQISSATNTEPEQIRQPISTTPIPIRQCAEIGTQTIQVRLELTLRIKPREYLYEF